MCQYCAACAALYGLKTAGAVQGYSQCEICESPAGPCFCMPLKDAGGVLQIPEKPS